MNGLFVQPLCRYAYRDWSEMMAVEVKVRRNRKIRLKLTDWCNLECPFCHSEGAPGASDVTVTDPGLVDALSRLRRTFDTVHLTGGEPTSYRHLGAVVELLRGLDYRLAMTTNGLFNQGKVAAILGQLDYVNISFHTLNPAYFESFMKTSAKSARVLELISDNIAFLSDECDVRLNTVVSGAKDEQQLTKVHEFAELHVAPLKLVPDWRSTVESKEFIAGYLDRGGFTHTTLERVLPGSNVRRIYTHPARPAVEVKDIEHFRPNFLCEGCEITHKCVESFSFLRLERTPARVRVCIYKPEWSPEEFFPVFEKELEPLFDAVPWQ